MTDDIELAEIVKQVVGRMLNPSAPDSASPPPDAGSAAPGAPDIIPGTTHQAPGTKHQAPGTESMIHPPAEGIIALGADHGGYAMKEKLKRRLESQGCHVIDCGTHSTDAVDYPDYARAVAVLVGEGRAWRGIMIDGAGIGSCMAANKIKGVRASMCYDASSAHNAREHNDANLLTLGAGLIGENLAFQIVDAWLTTPFGGGRHERRVEKIMALEGGGEAGRRGDR